VWLQLPNPARDPVVDQVPPAGSYSSAPEVSQLHGETEPPTTRTFRFGSNVAVWPTRTVAILPVVDQKWFPPIRMAVSAAPASALAAAPPPRVANTDHTTTTAPNRLIHDRVSIFLLPLAQLL
jgi:hypothetical protein